MNAHDERSIGSVDYAIKTAEGATFDAANAALHHLPAGRDRDRVVAALLEANRTVRGITGGAAIIGSRPTAFVYGARVRSAAGRAWQRITRGGAS